MNDRSIAYFPMEMALLPDMPKRDQFIEVMRRAIALNASQFNTQRMVREYVAKAYS